MEQTWTNQKNWITSINAYHFASTQVFVTQEIDFHVRSIIEIQSIVNGKIAHT